jgi:hypothetical protein
MSSPSSSSELIALQPYSRLAGNVHTNEQACIASTSLLRAALCSQQKTRQAVVRWSRYRARSKYARESGSEGVHNNRLWLQ